MMTLKSLLGVYQEETDSLGQFVFQELYFYDTIYVSLKAENSRGKAATTIEIDTSSSTSPKSNYLPKLTEYNNDEPFETLTFLSETKSDLIQKKWNLSDTILIGDINVVARKYKNDDGHFRPYLEADFVYDLNNNMGPPGNIFESIEGRIPGVMMDPKLGIVARGDKVKIYLDGIEDRIGLTADLPMQMFDKVEYIKMGISAGINYKGGILFFYTKRGMKNVKAAPVKSQGMEGLQVVGYSVSRKFYTPEYDLHEEPEKKDIRNTIWWNPLVRTDSTGVAIEPFYQSDETGKMKIVVEGVTEDGKLCRGIGNYRVKE
jgi:hypothetical protein